MSNMSLMPNNIEPEIFWLTDPKCQLPERVGNKGAVLARLTAAGYNVPSGFCITTEISSQGQVERSDTGGIYWTTKLENALKRLPSPWVVRSSSNAEDTLALAFPGLFKTVLGLTTVDQVLEAIATVVDSRELKPLQQYANHFAIDLSSIKMAIIVQELVNPICAGVAFSRHPVTGERKVVIESNYGLGDTLVDGSITPDQIEVLENGQVSVVRIGTKRIKSIFTSNGLIRTELPESERRILSLSQIAARNLATLVRSIESDFGQPQDIEWATTSEAIFILQARPITTTKEVS
jgi:phosphoenolpyruvate synthase/pyruvate phosphate dikinase